MCFAEFDLATLEDTSPAASNLDGALVQQFEQSNADLRVSQLVPTGGTVRFDWVNRRQETNSLFATVNPNYRVDMDLHYVQPLLRNMGRLVTDRNIRIARTNQDISLENFELQVTAVIVQVENAYWNLAESIAQLEVAEQSLALAKQLHEQNEIRVEVGTLAPLELVQSEAGVAQRDVDIIRARAAVGDRGDVLRELLNIERDARSLAGTHRPDQRSIRGALRGRHGESYRHRFGQSTRAQTAAARYVQSRARRAVLQEPEEAPTRFCRFLRLQRTGRPRRCPRRRTVNIIDTIDGGYSDALDQIFDTDFEGWRTALNFAFPIQNRTAKAQSAIAEVNFERSQMELQNLELAIVTEVRQGRSGAGSGR